MIPVDKVRDIIKKHQSLEKELSSGAIEKKLFAAKSKEYSELNAVICYAKEYLIFDKTKDDFQKKDIYLTDSIIVKSKTYYENWENMY